MGRSLSTMLAALAAMTLSACVLSDPPADADGSTGLRVIVGTNGQPEGTLSQAGRHERCPQLAWAADPGPAGAVYLYYLADEDYKGKSGTAVYRARRVSPTTFSNPEFILHYGTNLTSFIVLTNVYDPATSPPWPMLLATDAAGRFVRIGWTQLDGKTELVLGGPDFHAAIGGYHYTGENRFFVLRDMPLVGTSLVYYRLYNGIPDVQPGVNYVPLDRMAQALGFPEQPVRGFWPQQFEVPRLGGNVFGFLAGYGNRLRVLFNINTFATNGASSFQRWLAIGNRDPLLYAATEYFRGDRFGTLPIPRDGFGVVDRDPFPAAGEGLYFASDRGGDFDLYFAPARLAEVPDVLTR